MRVIIYGAGGIGGVIGAQLYKADQEVVLIARGPHLEKVQKDGLRYETPNGTDILPLTVVGHPSEIDHGRAPLRTTLLNPSGRASRHL